MRKFLSRLRRDRDGVSIVEFAMISPALLTLLLGVFDVSYNMYSNSILFGTVQKAARDSALEGANPDTQNAKVEASVLRVSPQATFTHRRVAYTTFTEVGTAEDFTDINNDGVCSDGEPFEDANGNGTWDPDRGVVGAGGARDAVLYTVSISYPRAFPLAKFIGISPTYSMDVQTVLRNQPWDDQNTAATAGSCI